MLEPLNIYHIFLGIIANIIFKGSKALVMGSHFVIAYNTVFNVHKSIVLLYRGGGGGV